MEASKRKRRQTRGSKQDEATIDSINTIFFSGLICPRDNFAGKEGSFSLGHLYEPQL